MRLTLLGVVDPAIVSFFDGGSAARFPNDWKGDWYDERRYVGMRIKMRHLESVPTRNLHVFTTIFDPITLIDSKGNVERFKLGLEQTSVELPSVPAARDRS